MLSDILEVVRAVVKGWWVCAARVGATRLKGTPLYGGWCNEPSDDHGYLHVLSAGTTGLVT